MLDTSLSTPIRTVRTEPSPWLQVYTSAAVGIYGNSP